MNEILMYAKSFLVCLIFVNINCISYLYHVSSEQIKTVLNRKLISEIIQSEKNDEAKKKKLALIEKVREFAIQEIKLNADGGFRYYSELPREEVGWNVSASYPLKFESYTWWFPFAGRVPYKGYFNLEKAKEEEKQLIEKGFDTRVRITAGYSTLGWFSDPVFSPQLRMSEEDLVSLVIHELTHATVYFPGESNFNESYASFVEEIGTEKFYQKYDSEKTKSILEKRNKRRAESNFIISEVKKTAEKLKIVYANENLSDTEKISMKGKIIEEYKQSIIESKAKFEKFDIEKFKLQKMNNENFIGILRYHSGVKFFKETFAKLDGDFSKFHIEIQKVKNLTKEDREKLLKD
jgi:predicted aminopeptidase